MPADPKPKPEERAAGLVVVEEEDGRAEATASRPHILCADDEPDMLALYQACLGPQGYRVTCAADGPAALELARRDPPAACLLDLEMPGMDGLEVCERLRAHPQTAAVPVLMVTASDRPADRVRCLRAGADDVLVKPFPYDELVARVEALLRRLRPTTGIALEADARRRLQILKQALRGGPETLVPVPHTAPPLGFHYPATAVLSEAPEGYDPTTDLEWLHREGYLERTFHDVTLLCPFCGHHDLHLREVCPACGSPDLHPVEMLHHYRCAFVGPREVFERNGRLVCPKCRGVLRHIGLEYEAPTDTVRCGACERGFQEPDVAARCRNCRRPFPPEQAERRRVYAYALTGAGRFAAESGFLVASGSPGFWDAEIPALRPEFFRELLSHEVARGQSLGHPTALLRVRVPGLGEAARQLGPGAVRRRLQEVVETVRRQTRPVDRIGRLRPEELVVLLPGTDARGAARVARAVAQAWEQRREEDAPPLTFAWTAHPSEAGDAQALLSRVLEAPPTAALATAGVPLDEEEAEEVRLDTEVGETISSPEEREEASL